MQVSYRQRLRIAAVAVAAGGIVTGMAGPSLAGEDPQKDKTSVSATQKPGSPAKDDPPDPEPTKPNPPDPEPTKPNPPDPEPTKPNPPDPEPTKPNPPDPEPTKPKPPKPEPTKPGPKPTKPKPGEPGEAEPTRPGARPSQSPAGAGAGDRDDTDSRDITRVANASETLPLTGVDAATVAGAGVVLLAGGVVLVWSTRTRRRAES